MKLPRKTKSHKQKFLKKKFPQKKKILKFRNWIQLSPYACLYPGKIHYMAKKLCYFNLTRWILDNTSRQSGHYLNA